MSLVVICAPDVNVPPAYRFGRCPGDVVVFDSDAGTVTASTIGVLLAVRSTLAIDEIVVLAGGGPEALDDQQLARHTAQRLCDAMPAELTVRAAYTDPSATTLVAMGARRAGGSAARTPHHDPRRRRRPVEAHERAEEHL
jgi:hypothetical protein